MDTIAPTAQTSSGPRVLVVDDTPLMRTAISNLVDGDPRLELVHCPSDSDPALHAALADVIVVDSHQAGSLPHLIADIASRRPNTKLIAFSNVDARHAKLLLAAGATEVVPKSGPPEDLLATILRIYQPAVRPLLVRNSPVGSSTELSETEVAVLGMIATGATDAEIGRSFFISPRTVQNLLSCIRTKAGVTRRPELIRWAMEHGHI